MKARKSAGRRSTKAKTAGKKQTDNNQDSAVAKGPARAATKRAARRAASASKVKSGRGCGDCGAGCMVEDPIEVAKRTMKGSVPAIVDAMVKKAKQGSCPHAKTLLEMTGAKFMFQDDTKTGDGGESWAKLVLERMEKAEREKASAES